MKFGSRHLSKWFFFFWKLLVECIISVLWQWCQISQKKSNKMHIHVFHMEKSFNGGSDKLISFMVFQVFMAGPQNVIWFYNKLISCKLIKFYNFHMISCKLRKFYNFGNGNSIILVMGTVSSVKWMMMIYMYVKLEIDFY